MRLCTKALIAGLSFSVGSAVVVKAPAESVASPVAVPVPPAPTATLPKPAETCEKLDQCLADNGGKDNQEALKTCVTKFLGQEKGEKAWTALAKDKATLEALKGKKKPSLALLRTTEPNVYKAVLAALFAGSSKVMHLSDLCVLEEPKKAKNLRSPAHVPVPKAPTVALPKPPGGHPGTAKLAKTSNQTVEVPSAPSDCDKGKGLPTPHGHPEAAAKDKQEKHEPPATCQQLDACLENIDHKEYMAGYNACVHDFCQKLHGDKKFEGKDDPRTSLCDQKGMEALDVLAKAAAEGKENQKKKKSALLTFKVVQSVLAKGATAAELEFACK